MAYPIRVLFICTGNSARSQIAEALLRHYGDPDFEVSSAGSDPQPVHPFAIEAMREVGIDLSTCRSKHYLTFLGTPFDFIITVCDRVRDDCPTFPGDNRRIHWSFEDAAATPGSEAERRLAFKRVRNELANRIRPWVTVQRRRILEQGLKP